MSVKIAPSLLSADFACLAEEIRAVQQGGADWIHVDVMDGHFVPNITMGPLVVEAIRPHTSLPLDVHLMIINADAMIPAFAAAGSNNIIVQVEACPHLHRTIHQIKELGVRAGVALNPATPLAMIEPILSDVDMVLIMTVNPGFGGQAFIPSTLSKITTLRSMLQENDLQHIDIEVDGGINEHTAPLVIKAGANVLVAGSAVFNEADRGRAIQKLKDSGEA